MQSNEILDIVYMVLAIVTSAFFATFFILFTFVTKSKSKYKSVFNKTCWVLGSLMISSCVHQIYIATGIKDVFNNIEEFLQLLMQMSLRQKISFCVSSIVLLICGIVKLIICIKDHLHFKNSIPFIPNAEIKMKNAFFLDEKKPVKYYFKHADKLMKRQLCECSYGSELNDSITNDSISQVVDDAFKENKNKHIYVLLGEPGTGKSIYAMTECYALKKKRKISPFYYNLASFKYNELVRKEELSRLFWETIEDEYFKSFTFFKSRWDKRLDRLLNEAKKKNLVLFIDSLDESSIDNDTLINILNFGLEKLCNICIVLISRTGSVKLGGGEFTYDLTKGLSEGAERKYYLLKNVPTKTAILHYEKLGVINENNKDLIIKEFYAANEGGNISEINLFNLHNILECHRYHEFEPVKKKDTKNYDSAKQDEKPRKLIAIIEESFKGLFTKSTDKELNDLFIDASQLDKACQRIAIESLKKQEELRRIYGSNPQDDSEKKYNGDDSIANQKLSDINENLKELNKKTDSILNELEILVSKEFKRLKKELKDKFILDSNDRFYQDKWTDYFAAKFIYNFDGSEVGKLKEIINLLKLNQSHYKAIFNFLILLIENAGNEEVIKKKLELLLTISKTDGDRFDGQYTFIKEALKVLYDQTRTIPVEDDKVYERPELSNKKVIVEFLLEKYIDIYNQANDDYSKYNSLFVFFLAEDISTSIKAFNALVIEGNKDKSKKTIQLVCDIYDAYYLTHVINKDILSEGLKKYIDQKQKRAFKAINNFLNDVNDEAFKSKVSNIKKINDFLCSLGDTSSEKAELGDESTWELASNGNSQDDSKSVRFIDVSKKDYEGKLRSALMDEQTLALYFYSSDDNNKEISINFDLGNLAKYVKYIQIGKNIETIDRYAFAFMKGLEKVVLSDKVKKIEEFAFNGCTRLKRIVIPSSVKHIGESAFEDCISLKRVIFNKNDKNDKNNKKNNNTDRKNSSSQETIILNHYLFEDCINLSNVHLVSDKIKIEKNL